MAKAKKPTEKELIKELETFKKAKEENDGRFMGERDAARIALQEYEKWATNELDSVAAQVRAAQAQHAKMTVYAEQVEFQMKEERVVALAEVARLTRERDALMKEADDSASRIVELQEMLKQKLSPAESCKEERAAGNGGCGTCAICCNELKEALATKMYESGQIVKIAEVVLGEIQAERVRQDAKWGQQNHPDGTCDGPGGAKTAQQHADAARSICNHFAKVGQLTWMHILTEEMMEAFAETDQDKLKTELIQAAAVATAWVECIDRRKRDRAPRE